MVTATHYGDVTVLTLKGELTAESVDDFIEHRDQVLAQSRCHLVVDCAAITAFDSSALSALNATRKTCEQLHGAMKVCGLDDIGKKIFEITRLDRLFEMYDDLDSAVRSFA